MTVAAPAKTRVPSSAQPATSSGSRDYLSFSAINSYRQCPLRHYFRYVVGLPEQTVSASLVFGGAIHASVEHHYRELLVGNPAPDLDSLREAYANAWTERADAEIVFGKGENRAVLDRLADRMLTAFQLSQLAQPAGTILGIEEELRGPVLPDMPDLLGRIDLLYDAGDAYVVTDLKTTRSRWSRDQADDSGEQLLLYSELVSQILPDKPVRLEFAVLTKTKAPAIERHEVANTVARRDRIKRIAARVWHAIKAQHFLPSPMSCPTCPFRKPCRAWAG